MGISVRSEVQVLLDPPFFASLIMVGLVGEFLIMRPRTIGAAGGMGIDPPFRYLRQSDR